jgi:hypothetical protein
LLGHGESFNWRDDLEHLERQSLEAFDAKLLIAHPCNASQEVEDLARRDVGSGEGRHKLIGKESGAARVNAYDVARLQ